MIDLIFSLVGLIFLVAGIFFFIPILFQEKSLTFSILIIIMIAGAIFALCNFLEKSLLLTPSLADTLGEGVGIFLVSLIMVLGIVAILEQNLISYQSNLEKIINSNPDPILILDRGYSLIFINPSAENLVGKRNKNLSPHIDFPIKNGEKKEMSIIRENGDKIMVEMHSAQILWKDKPVYLITLRDITERWKKSEEIKKAYQKADFYKDLLSHDISNIFQILFSGIDLISLFLGKREKLEYLKDKIILLKNQLKRGSELLNNVRKLSQIDNLKEKTPIKKIKMFPILDQSIVNINSMFPHKNINISLKTDLDNDISVQANELLEDVFDNLLINAVLHNDNPQVKILISVSQERKKDKKFVKIKFIDNARGIEDRLKETIFIRNPVNIKSKHGMGLGLSLVKKIVDFFDGKIWIANRIENNHTKGSIFIVELPKGLQMDEKEENLYGIYC